MSNQWGVSIPEWPIGLIAEYRLDLTAGAYPQHDAIPWSSARLWDTIEWMREQIGTRFRAPEFIPATFDPSEQLAPLNFKWSGTEGAVHYCDAADIIYQPGAVLVALCGIFKVPPPQVYLHYPGLDIRHPSTESPIGAPWPEHPQGPGIYHPSAADRHPFMSIHPQLVDGKVHYFKKNARSTMTGPFSSETIFYWQDMGVSLPTEIAVKTAKKSR